MTAAVALRAAGESGVAGWRAHLAALAAAAAALLALFVRDAADMAAIWWESDTFNHVLLIPPILAWLVWQRLPELRRLRPAAWLPGLALVALGGLAWLAGEAAGVAVARHLGLVLMLQGLVVALLGPAVALGLTFPLFFALFLVPAGEELVPPLQTLTAEMSMALLSLSGVPAHIEGVFITTPGGYFEVAEACSGVKFLIAMAALAALVANLCFRSRRRRALFVAAALLIPILANGVRAWGTIYVAHVGGNAFAVGFDHIVYGWIFFAVVIAAILAAGWPFFDRRPGDRWFDPEAMPKVRREAPLMLAAAAAVALAAMPPLWTRAVAAAGTAPPPAGFALPEVDGWQRAEPAGRSWRPHFAGADRLLAARYRSGEGHEVDLAVAVFARQSERRELVGYGQGAAPPGGAWAWTGDSAAPADGRAERIASHGVNREVVSFYRVGDIVTGSAAEVKLETLKVRLLGGPQRAVAVLVSAQEPAAGVSARPAIDAFLRDLGPVAPLADSAAGTSR